MELDRAPLLADMSRTGRVWCEAYSDLIDGWLERLLGGATDDDSGVALVAVGGYGRAELAPGSDIDVMLLHTGRADIDDIANRVWYPIWDSGLHLGHSVQTPKQALSLAADDLDTATALLSARHIAGDSRLAAEVGGGAHVQWTKKAKRWLEALGDRVEERHASAGEVAFRLEPDLKDGRGGLRDVHALRWAEAADRVIAEYDTAALDAAYTVLLNARVELQRITGRNNSLLSVQEQAGVAAALGYAGADELMKTIAEAARTIAWTSDDTWRRIRYNARTPIGRLGSRRSREIAPGIVLRDEELHVDRGVAERDPLMVLRVAVAAARDDVAIERESLELLATTPTLPSQWSEEARALFVELFLAGRQAIRVVEALDQRGVWTRLLPEWTPVRAKPQHNAYHRFTVDRHLLEATANAAALRDRVKRPDLLVMGALLHDLGKGHPGDHTEVGMELVAALTKRMGFDDHDRGVLVAMVQHHLLLPDVATRRDLDDPSTIERVAREVGDLERLELLAALTEADSQATGPSAWSPWKAGLLSQLVERVAGVLAAGEMVMVPARTFPAPEHLDALATPGQRIEGRGNLLTVVTDDRQGLFARVTGVLAMHGLDVLSAGVHSTDDGRALEEFIVNDPYRDETPWPKVVNDIERALDGRLAVNARVAERARTYGKPTPYLSGVPRGSTVHIDNAASADATVIDVETVDRIGVLYAIARALSEMDLDVRSAKVQTLGLRVVDAFYVRDRAGDKINDPAIHREIEKAILHNLASYAS
ncbi:MAG TPA: [protein-PII] uridylyltransferase [Acidimicrobiales bacterium]|nr:[protein-PII] uridylyltransferase [Acidimicrobiales bacterium]